MGGYTDVSTVVPLFLDHPQDQDNVVLSYIAGGLKTGFIHKRLNIFPGLIQEFFRKKKNFPGQMLCLYMHRHAYVY